MGFSANLQHLRATRSMTQEQLAMLLGVSRQAVSKWESDAAYPEMDKLLRLCDIFECPLDDLARGDLTHRPDDPALSVAGVPASDICDYDRHMRARAFVAATGVSCALLGLAGFCGAGGIAVFGVQMRYLLWPWAFLLAGVLPACALLLSARNAHRSFTRRHPFVEDFYSGEEKARARRRTVAAWCAAAVLAAAGIAVCLFQTGPLQHLYGGLASLNVALACAAWIAVFASMMAARTDVAAYNRRMERRSAWEDIEEQRLALLARTGACAPDERAGSAKRTEYGGHAAQGGADGALAPAPLSEAFDKTGGERKPHPAGAAARSAPAADPACTHALYRRVSEQRKAAAGIVMALSAIAAAVMLFALHSPNWLLAPIIGALVCVIAWIAVPFVARNSR